MAQQHVLVVDDDPHIRKFVQANLAARNYEVTIAGDGVEALELIQDSQPDLIVLDLMMPRVDGLTVCRRVREFSGVPIIVLSARGEDETKVQALDLGADDYLTKPFSVQELLARVRAALRRASLASPLGGSTLFNAGDLSIDMAGRRVSKGNTVIHLTPTEYSLLRELVRQVNRVVTHEVLLDRVWGPEYRGADHYLHIYVGRLRRKLGNAPNGLPYLVTEAGVGYRFQSPGVS